MVRISLVVVALIALTLFAGCGGSDQKAGTGSAPLSAQDYLAALREPITSGNKAAAAWDEKVRASKGDLPTIGDATKEYAAVEQSSADTIASLKPPSQAASAQTALVDSYHREIADLTAATQAVAKGDLPGVQVAIRKADATADDIDAKLGALQKAVAPG
jgi:hypothetical protein